jgi:hypothetical protein
VITNALLVPKVRRLIHETSDQNSVSLAETKFTDYMHTDGDPQRFQAHLFGPFAIVSPGHSHLELRAYAQITSWNDGYNFVQYIIQDCEGDFVYYRPDLEGNVPLKPISYKS